MSLTVDSHPLFDLAAHGNVPTDSQEVAYKCFVAVDFTGVVINFKRKNDERKIKNEKKKGKQTNKQSNQQKKPYKHPRKYIKLYVKLMYNYQHQLSADFADAASSEISSRRKKRKERNE